MGMGCMQIGIRVDLRDAIAQRDARHPLCGLCPLWMGLRALASKKRLILSSVRILFFCM